MVKKRKSESSKMREKQICWNPLGHLSYKYVICDQW